MDREQRYFDLQCLNMLLSIRDSGLTNSRSYADRITQAWEKHGHEPCIEEMEVIQLCRQHELTLDEFEFVVRFRMNEIMTVLEHPECMEN